MLEALVEFFFECLIQIVIEMLVELGFHSLREPFRKRPMPWLAIPGYALLGAAAGSFSLWVFPKHFTPDGWTRIAVVAFVPIVAGVSMAALGAWRARRGDQVLRIDRFSYGYLFALCFALVRYRFAA